MFVLLLKVFLSCLFIHKFSEASINSQPSIIIVGSGPSGIAAATKLLKNHFTNIQILEAENRIGGRINSVKFGDAYVDFGAEFIHGEEGNIVYSMVKDFKIIKHAVENLNCVLSNGETVETKLRDKIIAFAESLEASSDYIDACRNVSSVGECLEIQMIKLPNTVKHLREKKILSQITDWVRSHLSSLDSTFDLNDLRIITNYKTCAGDQGMNWNGLGYKTILDIMMQKYPTNENQLPIDDKILLEKEVVNITGWQNNDAVVIVTKDGITYRSDHVIFTPSVGVLKANYHTLFSPQLPKEKIDAINGIGFGAIIKIVMYFPVPWWKEEVLWLTVWTEEDKQKLKEKNLEWLIDLNAIAPAENNPKVLITWYAGVHVPLIETLSDEMISEGRKYILNKFLGSQYNITMPEKILRTFWYTNPHFRGTYSYESVKGHSSGSGRLPEKLERPLLNQNKPTVLFAGEATHPYYFSTVHGAIESGYREAQRLINYYEKESLK